MAEDAITPQQALETLSAVRHYRERLTSQAAGILWILWGLVLTLVYSIGIQVDLTHIALDGSRLMPFSYAIGIIGMVLALTVGAVLTNLILRAQALQALRTHPRWVPFAVALGLVALYMGVAFGLQFVAIALHVQAFAPFHLLTVGGAFVLAYLQRKRVSPAAGILAGVFLLLLMVALFFPVGTSFNAFSLQARAATLIPLVAYTAVGLFYFRQG